MGKIKKILENELVGGTQSTDIYPVTSVKAVYDENNKRLDHILDTKENLTNKVTSINANADDAHYPSAKAVKDSLAKVKNIEVTPDMLSESTKQFINASGGGTITNFADNEDLATVDNALKLADKAYDPITYSGMGRKYLRKNFVDGKNILTQEMLPSANTIYIVQYDYDLNGATITIPENCVLDFQGGSFSNGTLICNNTEIIGTLSCFEKNLILDGTINGNGVKFDWWKCEKSTIEEYNLFINGNNTEFGVAPQISDTNRVILKNHIAKYIIYFGLGIYPFDDKVEITNNFRIKGIDSSKTLIWCPYSSFLYMSGGGATYPFIKNISIESLKNVLCTLSNKVNGIHGLVIDYSKCISYTEHTFYNDRTTAGGTNCPIYGSKISFSQFYAGRDKGCFTNYTSGNNIYNNVVDAFLYFNNSNPGYKGIMRCLFWNSTVFELRESNILYCGMKYVAYYDDVASQFYIFNARKCIFEGAGQSEVAGERKGFLNIIKCDYTYKGIDNFNVKIEDCQLINNSFDKSVAININGSVTNFNANIPSNFYIYGAYNLYNVGENTLYAISIFLDQGKTKRRLYVYNNTGNTGALKKASLISYSKETANSLNVPTTLISECEKLGAMSYIEIAVNIKKKNSPIILPDKNITLNDGFLVRYNDYLKYQIGSRVYRIICSKPNSYIVSSYDDYKTYFKAGYSDSCFIIVGDIDLNGETINVRANITFLFLGGSINNGIISSLKNTKFVNFSGTATFNLSTDYGAFADKPQNPYKGQKYFCTDKQTAEGATTGIEIIHKGNDVWVDALGRVVS